MPNLANIILSLVVILISLTFHEAAHAWAAYKLGDPTAKMRGRMSLNPLVHIDLFGTILFPILLSISGLGVFGWAKPVPVDLYNLKNPKRDDGLIAAAGPFANFLVAILASIIIRILIQFSGSGDFSDGMRFVITVFYLFVQINVLLMVFNLIPLHPLDGASVLEMFLSPQAAFKFRQLSRYSMLIFLVLVLFTNILYTIYIAPVSRIFFRLLGYISGLDI